MSPVMSAALRGVEGIAVEVEVRISSLLPGVDLVGLPEAEVRESTARVRAAIGSTGLSFPDRRVTVNLAPAGLRKGGAALDLAIAVGVLAANGDLGGARLDTAALLGELALDGRLRPVRGALALTLAARRAGLRAVVVPRENAQEAGLAPRITVHPAGDLASVLRHLRGDERLPCAELPEPTPAAAPSAELADVRGQESGKRALEVTAAGGHGLLLRGPPGSGKTMLARRLAGILPAPSFEEVLEATLVHGAAGRLGGDVPVLCERPFRAPHHSASLPGLLGGGNPPRPGEVSLAHRGVLFLDELPEFERRTLEALRQVLEDRRVVVVRAGSSCVFPAHFQLVTAANPCPCGWRLSRQRDCRCDPGAVARYASRLSGPLLDRIDLHVGVPAIAWKELSGPRSGPTTLEARERVAAARDLQQRRLAPLRDNASDPRLRTNAEIPDGPLDELVQATPDARTLLGRAVDRLALTARGARRVLRVARTVADLEGADKVGPVAVAEALGYRTEEIPDES